MNPNKKSLNIGIFTKAPQQDKDSSIKTYITGHYIAWVESFGHNVVPIPYDIPLIEIDKYLNQVNGIIFQGALCRIKWPYTENEKQEIIRNYGHLPNECIVEYVFNKFIKKELPKTPLLLVCWAMELLPLIITNKIREEVFISSVGTKAINLNLFDIDKQSQLFSYFDKEDIQNLNEKKQTYHNHVNSLSVDFFKQNKELDIFKITSTSYDEKGLNFICSYESIDYPLIALQFHPEKIGNIMKLELSQNENSIKLNRKFGEAFFKLCEENQNILIDKSIIIDSSIKYSPEKQTKNIGFEIINDNPYYVFVSRENKENEDNNNNKKE